VKAVAPYNIEDTSCIFVTFTMGDVKSHG